MGCQHRQNLHSKVQMMTTTQTISRHVAPKRFEKLAYLAIHSVGFKPASNTSKQNSGGMLHKKVIILNACVSKGV